MYRFLSEVSQPFTFFFLFSLLAFVALWLLQRSPMRRMLPVGLGLLALWALSTPAMAGWAVGSLERRYPPMAPDSPALARADAIVVLASGVRSPNSLRPAPELAEGTVVRTLHGARLYHAGPPRPIIVSGGTVSGRTRIATLMAELLVTLGVPEHDVIVEDQSADTYENAVESARLLRGRGLTRPVLVTEATHLLRSVRCFQAQGVDVIPVGVNYRTSDFGSDWLQFLPNAGAASTVRVATHEWVGMVWYWLNGYFDSASVS